jgi:hypothetical protein
MQLHFHTRGNPRVVLYWPVIGKTGEAGVVLLSLATSEYLSGEVLQDEELSRLLTFPNV